MMQILIVMRGLQKSTLHRTDLKEMKSMCETLLVELLRERSRQAAKNSASSKRKVHQSNISFYIVCHCSSKEPHQATFTTSSNSEKDNGAKICAVIFCQSRIGRRPLKLLFGGYRLEQLFFSRQLSWKNSAQHATVNVHNYSVYDGFGVVFGQCLYSLNCILTF